MKNKIFRRADKLPKLRGLPHIGQLLYIQDLDATIFPVIVLELVHEKTKRGKSTKRLLEIKILSGSKITSCMLHDLRVLKDHMPE